MNGRDTRWPPGMSARPCLALPCQAGTMQLAARSAPGAVLPACCSRSPPASHDLTLTSRSLPRAPLPPQSLATFRTTPSAARTQGSAPTTCRPGLPPSPATCDQWVSQMPPGCACSVGLPLPPRTPPGHWPAQGGRGCRKPCSGMYSSCLAGGSVLPLLPHFYKPPASCPPSTLASCLLPSLLTSHNSPACLHPGLQFS